MIGYSPILFQAPLRFGYNLVYLDDFIIVPQRLHILQACITIITEHLFLVKDFVQ